MPCTCAAGCRDSCSPNPFCCRSASRPSGTRTWSRWSGPRRAPRCKGRARPPTRSKSVRCRGGGPLPGRSRACGGCEGPLGQSRIWMSSSSSWTAVARTAARPRQPQRLPMRLSFKLPSRPVTCGSCRPSSRCRCALPAPTTAKHSAPAAAARTASVLCHGCCRSALCESFAG